MKKILLAALITVTSSNVLAFQTYERETCVGAMNIAGLALKAKQSGLPEYMARDAVAVKDEYQRIVSKVYTARNDREMWEYIYDYCEQKRRLR